MKHNPDNRKDNVEKIQYNINKTIQNIEAAEELISKVDNEKTVHDLEAKNDRREAALKGMRREIKDEALHRNHENHK